MKKILLLFAFLQCLYVHATDVQITFVANYSVFVINPFEGSPSVGTATTDDAVNADFQAHGIVSCYDSFSDDYSIIFAEYLGSDLNAFIADLQDNPNVASVKVCPGSSLYADRMYVKLFDGSDGNPIDNVLTPNGNIVTTNNELNQIFEQYNVKAMVKLIPTLDYYIIYFEGDAIALFDTLSMLDTLMENPEYIGVPLLLSTVSNEFVKPAVYPNPFSDVLQIETPEPINSYLLFDNSGRLLADTSSKSVLDATTPTLSNGLYILQIKSATGMKSVHRLIKK